MTFLRTSRIAAWVAVIGYMIFTNQNVNFMLLGGRFVALIVGPLISLREGGTHLTSYEYNLQTLALSGILSSAIALWYLYNTSNPLGLLLDGRSKEYVVLSMAASFRSFETFFGYCYCYPENGDRKLSTLDACEDAFSLPALMALMLIFQYGEFDPKYSAMIAAFHVYRIIRFVGTCSTAAIAQTERVPRQTFITYTLSKSVKSAPISSDYVWRVYGNTYDLTDYVAHHPGGKEAIMLGEGRDDCTALFQSYHPFNIGKAKKVLEKYRTSSLAAGDTIEKLTSSRHENDLFYDELSKRVAKTLKETYGIDPITGRAGTWLRWAWYSFILSSLTAGCVSHCMGSLWGSFWFGLFGALIGANIGHDGGHFAVSRIPFINDLSLWGTGLISNPIIWQHQHTYGHHSYTNVDDHDPDLHHFHISMRVQKNEHFQKIYKNQDKSWWVLMTFAFTTFATCYWYSIRFIFERSMHGAVDWSDRKRISRSVQLLVHFALYSVIVMIVPFFVHKSSYTALLSAVIHMFTCGFLFAIFSQVGHIGELTLGRDIEESRKKRHEIARSSWGAEQVETTNDFCNQSNFMFHFGGGLTNQIEHHLFPGLNHGHLLKIQPTVEQTCKEFNVQYKNYETFTEAMNDTLLYLSKLAKEDDAKKIS